MAENLDLFIFVLKNFYIRGKMVYFLMAWVLGVFFYE